LIIFDVAGFGVVGVGVCVYASQAAEKNTASAAERSAAVRMREL
jgi:hypothetical protein